MFAGLSAGLVLAAGGCLHDDGERRKILFATDRDGDYALYAMEEDGSGQSRVLGLPNAPPVAPAISPDRRRVLVLAADGLWALRLDDTSRVRLARGEVSSAAWSPDGERVVYASAGGLSVVGSDGKGRLRLTRRGGDGAAAWSPDGSHIAYGAEDGLWVIRADGSERTHLTRLVTSGFNGPVWAPDGTRIAFVGGDAEGEVEHLYVVEVRGAPRRLARNAGGNPTWSPAGAEVAFLSLPRPFDRRRAGIAIVDARDGRLVRRIGGFADPPIWSPDGEHVLFATAPSFDFGPKELPQVLIMQRDGSERRELTDPYPEGGSNHPIGWITDEHRTETPPRPAVESLQRGVKVLRAPHPVGLVSVEGDRVAIAPPSVEFESSRALPPLLLWSLPSGKVDRRMVAGCRGLGWPTLSGGRVVFDCNNSYIDSIDHSVRVFERRASVPHEVLVGRNTPGLLHSGVLVEGISGEGGLAMIATERMHQGSRVDRTLWRLVGNRPRAIRRGLGAGLLLAADSSRAALLLGSRSMAIVRADGRVLRAIDLVSRVTNEDAFVYGAARPVAFVGDRVVLVARGRLDVYSTRTGRLQRSVSIGRGARSAGAAGGLVAYVRGRELRVRRLSDGRELPFRVDGPLPKGSFRGLYIDRLVHATLSRAGLVYSYNVRTGPLPGRIVFVPLDELERRLNES